MMPIGYSCPNDRLTNEMLVKLYPEWTEEENCAKTGIKSHYVADENTTLQ